MCPLEIFAVEIVCYQKPLSSTATLAYKTPFIIRDLRSRTTRAAAQSKDAVPVRSVSGTTYFLLQN